MNNAKLFLQFRRSSQDLSQSKSSDDFELLGELEPRAAVRWGMKTSR
jgi:hypothetical protein